MDVPALPLQLLVQDRPEWRDEPVVVVDRDRPHGKILWVNERAWRARVLPGMRYAAGLSQCRQLCAGEVAAERVDAGIEDVVERLRGFSPTVEASRDEPGIFWVDATGLEPLESSLRGWARRLRRDLEAADLTAHVAVAPSRFGAYCAARSLTRRDDDVILLTDRAEEERTVHGTRLDRLHLDPKLRTALERLGVHTVGDFLRLPANGLGRRFGPEALRLHRRASGSLAPPLDPEPLAEPVDAWIELEHPEADATRLLFVIKRVLPSLLRETAERGLGLRELALWLDLDDGCRLEETVRTAEATRQEDQILDLVRLALDGLELSAGVVEMTLAVHGERVDGEQAGLFSETPRRDLSAANRALARLRTEFGREAVARAELRAGHLPEATFSWEPLEEARLPRPRATAERPLVRRLYRRPRPLPHRGDHEPDGWLVQGPEQGPVVKVRGPYRVSGGWWVREVDREYHFVETERGDVMWVFYDRKRRRWFLHGQVE